MSIYHNILFCLLFHWCRTKHGVSVHARLPGMGVLGCVSAGVPVEGVFGSSPAARAAALLFSSSSAIQGIDHWPLTCSNSCTCRQGAGVGDSLVDFSLTRVCFHAVFLDLVPFSWWATSLRCAWAHAAWTGPRVERRPQTSRRRRPPARRGDAWTGTRRPCKHAGGRKGLQKCPNVF